MPERIEFIRNAGAALTTRNVLDRVAPIRWLDRGPSAAPADNGWRVFSAADTSEYLATTENWVPVSYNRLCEIEPALIAAWPLPVGSRLELRDRDGGGRVLIDSTTGLPVADERLYPPRGAEPSDD